MCTYFFPSRYLPQGTPGSYSGGWQSQTLKDRFTNIIHQKKTRQAEDVQGGSGTPSHEQPIKSTTDYTSISAVAFKQIVVCEVHSALTGCHV